MAKSQPKRSDAWIAGVSHGASADNSYRNAQARVAQMTGLVTSLMSAWTAARDAFAADPSTSTKEAVDAAYSAYVEAQSQLTDEQSTVSNMQEMYATGLDRDFNEQGNPLLNDLESRINGYVDQINDLETVKSNHMGSLSMAQAEKMGYETEIDQMSQVPENIEDWQSFSESFGQEDPGVSMRAGVDVTITQLTESIGTIDGKLQTLYGLYDQAYSQYESIRNGEVSFGGLDTTTSADSYGDKTLPVSVVNNQNDVLQQNMPLENDGKDLDLSGKPVENDEVIFVDEQGQEFEADILSEEDFMFDSEKEDPFADAETRLHEMAEIAENNWAKESLEIAIPSL